MGLGDRFRKVMGIPVNPDPSSFGAPRSARPRPIATRWRVWRTPSPSRRSSASTTRSPASSRWKSLFPKQAREWLRWQGQTHYIGRSWRASSDADRVACYRRALECYFEAAALGDRSQEQNVVELCEALAAEKDVPEAEKESAVHKYLASVSRGRAAGARPAAGLSRATVRADR